MILGRIIQKHWTIALVALIISALGFGIFSYNLFFVINASFNFIAEHGWLAIEEGGAMQVLELFCLGVISAAFYIILRSSERVLIEKFLN